MSSRNETISHRLWRMTEPQNTTPADVNFVFSNPHLHNIAMVLVGEEWHQQISARLSEFGYHMIAGAVAIQKDKDGLLRPEKFIDNLESYKKGGAILGPHAADGIVIRNGLGVWVQPPKVKKRRSA